MSHTIDQKVSCRITERSLIKPDCKVGRHNGLQMKIGENPIFVFPNFSKLAPLALVGDSHVWISVVGGCLLQIWTAGAQSDYPQLHYFQSWTEHRKDDTIMRNNSWTHPLRGKPFDPIPLNFIWKLFRHNNKFWILNSKILNSKSWELSSESIIKQGASGHHQVHHWRDGILEQLCDFESQTMVDTVL